MTKPVQYVSKSQIIAFNVLIAISYLEVNAYPIVQNNIMGKINYVHHAKAFAIPVVIKLLV